MTDSRELLSGRTRRGISERHPARLRCTARPLRSSVAWHCLTLVAIGLPVGILIGTSMRSVTWREFAEGLGVVASLRLPAGWLTVVTVAAVVVALVAGASPAHGRPERSRRDLCPPASIVPDVHPLPRRPQGCEQHFLERTTGFEPATLTLARA